MPSTAVILAVEEVPPEPIMLGERRHPPEPIMLGERRHARDPDNDAVAFRLSSKSGAAGST